MTAHFVWTYKQEDLFLSLSLPFPRTWWWSASRPWWAASSETRMSVWSRVWRTRSTTPLTAWMTRTTSTAPRLWATTPPGAANPPPLRTASLRARRPSPHSKTKEEEENSRSLAPCGLDFLTSPLPLMAVLLRLITLYWIRTPLSANLPLVCPAKICPFWIFSSSNHCNILENTEKWQHCTAISTCQRQQMHTSRMQL